MPVPASRVLDQATLERLYADLERPLYNVVYRWVWNADDAQDLVQEAFVRLWRMRDRVDVERAEPLVYRIALNLASNQRRRQRTWRWLSLEVLRGRAAAQPSSQRALEQHEREAALRVAVDSLPEKLRRVVMLSELGEMSYREVADVLEIPMGTVASRRNAALKKLRAYFDAAASSIRETTPGKEGAP